MDRDPEGQLLVFIPPDPDDGRGPRRFRLAALGLSVIALVLAAWLLVPSAPSSRRAPGAPERAAGVDSRVGSLPLDRFAGGGPPAVPAPAASPEPAPRRDPAPSEPDAGLARPAESPPTPRPAPAVPAPQPAPRDLELAEEPRPTPSPRPDRESGGPSRVPSPPAPSAPAPSIVLARPVPQPTPPPSPPPQPAAPSVIATPAPGPPSTSPAESVEPGAMSATAPRAATPDPSPPAPPVPPVAVAPAPPPAPPGPVAVTPATPPPTVAPGSLASSRPGVPELRPDEVRPAPEGARTPASAPPVPATPPSRSPDEADRPLVRGAPPAGSPGGASALALMGAAAAPSAEGRRLPPADIGSAAPVPAPPAAGNGRLRPALDRRLADAVRTAVVRIGAPGRGGAGFIVDPSGYIVTSHQVANTAGPLEVTLHDGRKLPVRIVARDPFGNVAVLKVDATGLPSIALGDSRSVRVGEPVMALGRGAGSATDVAVGVIRATGDGTGGNLATDLPGRRDRTGGPLVNARGEAVGVATGSAAGHAAAAPIDRVKPILADLRAPAGLRIRATSPDR
jgi:putative serine protease PepD